MRRPLLGPVAGLALLALATQGHAAPDKTGKGGPVDTTAAARAETSQVKPSEERVIEGSGRAKKKPGQQGAAAGQPTGPGSRPAVKGPRIPDALRKQLEAKLDARVEKDVKEIRGLRKEAIGLLTEFVRESPREAREMPEALMRLGELLWEEEREAFVERFKEWEKKPVDQRGPAPEPRFQPSRELFARVLKDYPWYGSYDLALYVDGFLSSEQGKPEEALVRFDRIIKEYPQSRFVPDAHMFRGEAMFNGQYDYAGALVEYEKVLEYKDSDLYGLALFKSAWCKWRLGDSDEAAKRFVQVFQYTSGKSDLKNKKQLDELEGEALKYLVEVFTEDEKNTANDMYAFLTKIGGERFAGKIVRQLATTFYDQAHYERGIEAYELLLKLEPTAPEAGDWVLSIAEGYDQTEDYPKLTATYKRLVDGYTTGGPWAKTQGDPKRVEATTDRIEKQLREHAVSLHGKAQHDKTSQAEWNAAADLYQVYLSKFDKVKGAYQIHYLLAEIQFRHQDKNTEAATHYMAAARTIPDEDDRVGVNKGLRHDAVYNAIAALERVRVSELEARKGKPDAGRETETDKKMVEALDLYAQLYPNDPQLPELYFRQGKLYYDYGVYDPAVKLFGTMVEKFPRHEKAQGAGALILDSFNKSKDYDNIETWARRLKSAPSFQDPKEQAKLDALIIQSVFKQGEQKSASGDHKAAAAAYLRAAKEFPKDQRAAQACVNAGIEAQRAGDVGLLKESATLITGKDYRDKPESPQGAWLAATTFQSMGLLSDAADYHEAIANLNDRQYPHYQKFEHTRDAAYNAVILRTATGETEKAILAGNKYLKDFGTSPDADEVVFQMGKAHQNAGRYKDAIDLYKKYLARPPRNQDHRLQGWVLLAKAQLKNGDDKQASESLKTAVTLGKQMKGQLGPDGKYAAAQARYMEGERILAKFDEVKIEGDVKQLGGRLKQKAQLLAEAAKVFLDTVSFSVAEWSTASLYQIGHMYETFGKALRESPPPSNLSEADKELFSQQIEEFVVPIEEKSLDAYENGWKKAMELGIYNQWTAKMRDALGRLNAELYPPFKEIGFEVRSEGPSPLPPLIEGPRRGGEVYKPSLYEKQEPKKKDDAKADAKDEKNDKPDAKKDEPVEAKKDEPAKPAAKPAKPAVKPPKKK
jgi:tetratricopeptide (TPR) repeat protein